MAVTQNEYTGNGSTTTYSFTFPYLKTSEVKASLDATVTTAFTLPTATTLQFNTAPANGAKIKIYRETDDAALAATFYAGSAIKSEDLNDNFTQNLYTTQEVNARYLSNLGGTMTGDFHLGEDVVLTFEGATANNFETTVTVVDPTADRTITLPNITGTVVTTGDTGTVTSTMIADATIATADIANSAVTTAKIADVNVTTAKIADNAVTMAKLANGALPTDITIASANIPDDTIVTADIADDAITSAKIATNAVGTDAIADNGVDTGAIAASAVTTAKIANDAITNDKIATNAVNADSIAASGVNTSEIADNAVTTAKINDGIITESKLASDAVTASKIAAGAVGSSELATGAVTSVKIADGTIVTADLANDAVTSAIIADGTIIDGNIANTTITGGKLANNTITATQIGANAVGASELADDSVDTAAIVDDAVGTAAIANNAVTTDHIADAELTTLAGMQSGTASILAGSTALTATLAEINSVVDGKAPQTTISDDDTKYPTSGAVVDYVAAQLAPIGGLEVIATDAAFPNTQPSAGVVISIADAGGLVVNGSGVSTTGRTVGNSTVTINGINSAFHSKTVDAGVAFMVSSTGSGQVYDFHKATLKEADILNLSNDINDFGNRYRVNAGEPSSNNDDGDLCWDTNADKMKVYDGTASAWKEVTSSGDFKFLVAVDAGTTTAATFDGSDTSFDLKETTNSGSAASVTSVYQLMISVNGVVQKPNTGSYSASEEGFYLTDSDTIRFCTAPPTGSSVFVVQFGSALTITTPGDNTVATAKIQNGAVTTDKVADNAITGAKVSDNLDIPDNNKIRFGTGNDLEIFHDGTNTYIDNDTGILRVQGDDLRLTAGNNEAYFVGTADGASELYYNGSKKAETRSDGFEIKDHLTMGDSDEIRLGNSSDLKLYHDGSNSFIDSHTGALKIRGGAAGNILLEPRDGEPGLYIKLDNATELYYDGSKKFETTSSGATVTGNLGIGTTSPTELVEIFSTGASTALEISSGQASTTTGESKIVLRSLHSASGTTYSRSEIGSLGVAGGDSDLIFRTTTDTNGPQERMRITSEGTVQVSGTLKIPDNDGGGQRLDIGSGTDLQIYHNGTNTIIDNNTGDLYIGSGFIGLYNAALNELKIAMYDNGAVNLYYDHSVKLATANYGVRFYGLLEGVDNEKIQLGSSGDLKIYHNGSDSLVRDEGTGGLYMTGSAVGIKNAAANENGLLFAENGDVQLYYDNVCKAKTASTGFHINDGNLTLNDNQKVSIGTGNDLQLYHTGTNSYIRNLTGDLYIQTNDGSGNAETGIALIPNGATELYYNNSKRLATGSNGVAVYGAEAGDAALYLYADEADDNADKWRLRVPNGSSGAPVSFTINNYFDGAWEHNLVCTSNGATELYYDGSKKLETTSSGVEVSDNIVLPDSGKVSFGASDDYKLYHASSNSYIINETGFLNIKTTGGGHHYYDANNHYFRAVDGENLANFRTNAGCFLYYDNATKVETDSSGCKFHGRIIPTQDDAYLLGNSSYKWSEVYAGEGTIQTSDRNEKNTIVESDLGLDFVNKLKPVSYKWNKPTKDNTRYGLIAQDVEEVLLTEGKTLKDFDGLRNDDGKYGLNYSEFISPLIKAVQELTEEVKVLKTKIATLEAE